MSRHFVLPEHDNPIAGENSRWLNQLNLFEQQETRRQAEFKQNQWPDLPDGEYMGRTYPHILPDEHVW